MYLAFVVSPEQPTPPPKYGGGEKRADIMIRKLIERGHAVDLYAAPGSTCPATRVYFANSTHMQQQTTYVHAIRQLEARNFAYDCIVDMSPHHVVSTIIDYPVVSIMGGDPLKLYPHDKVRNRVYVSKEFAAFNKCPDHPVLHNIIHEDPASVPMGDGSGGYALYVGAIRPEKGVHLAIEACARAGKELLIAGPIMDSVYWNEIQAGVNYLGVIENNSPAKWKLFGDAAVFVYPIQWCDACPLAPMEAMLAGTPVVACARGGIQTSLEPGRNGYFTKGGPADLEDAIYHACHLDRDEVRASILPIIDPEECITDLRELCRRAATGETW